MHQTHQTETLPSMQNRDCGQDAWTTQVTIAAWADDVKAVCYAAAVLMDRSSPMPARTGAGDDLHRASFASARR
jgi:hypothetical protein